MTGDASSRAYERLTRADGATAILMNLPTPPGRARDPYGAFLTAISPGWRRASTPFVAMDRGLRALNFSAPKIYGEDLDIGLLLIEDLGPGGVVDGERAHPGALRRSRRAARETATRRRCHMSCPSAMISNT